jgi:hypothetical protein
MSPFIYNLLTFSPLLLLAGGFLYVIERLQHAQPKRPLEPAERFESTYQLLDDGNEEQKEDELPMPGWFPPTDLLQDSDFEALSEDEGEDFEIDLADNNDLQLHDGTAQVATNAASNANVNELPTQPRRLPLTRNIGPKKARSLARRDQRRAYHEFIRSQAAARAAEEERITEEAAEAAYENACRRALLEEGLMHKRAVERQNREAALEVEKAADARDAATVKNHLLFKGEKMVELRSVAANVGRSCEWVEAVVRKERLIGAGEGGKGWRMVTRTGWWVDVGEDVLEKLWKTVEEKGRMEWGEMAVVLEELLSANSLIR